MVSWSAKGNKESQSTLSSQLSTLRLLGHFFELRAEHIHIPGVNECDVGASILSRLQLFVYDLDLLVEHLPGKPVDRHMHLVTLFAFHDEVGKVRPGPCAFANNARSAQQS